MKFDGLPALIAQMDQDCARAAKSWPKPDGPRALSASSLPKYSCQRDRPAPRPDAGPLPFRRVIRQIDAP